jgi:hypothetical protein
LSVTPRGSLLNPMLNPIFDLALGNLEIGPACPLDAMTPESIPTPAYARTATMRAGLSRIAARFSSCVNFRLRTRGL